MAEIGYCYGSEWQLLRCLGHHRNKFNKALGKALGIDDKRIEWIDYKPGAKNLTGDNEYQGIEFLEHLNLSKDPQIDVKNLWKEFWANQGRAQTWDGIFTCNGIVYLVEAKGHIKELKSDGCKSTNDNITNALTETINYMVEDSDSKLLEQWKGAYYQFANRLAFAYFMNKKCGIETKMVYIYFLNAWPKTEYNVTKAEVWRDAINDERKVLGITNSAQLDSILSEVFYDCKNQQLAH